MWRNHNVMLREAVSHSDLICPNYELRGLTRFHHPARQSTHVLEVNLAHQVFDATACPVAEWYWLGHPNSTVTRVGSCTALSSVLGLECPSDDIAPVCKNSRAAVLLFDVIHVRIDADARNWDYLLPSLWAMCAGTLILEEVKSPLSKTAADSFAALLEEFVAQQQDVHVVLETRTFAFAQLRRVAPRRLELSTSGSGRVVHIVAVSESESYDSRWTKYLDFLVTALPSDLTLQLTIERDANLYPRMVHLASRCNGPEKDACSVLVLLSSVRSVQYRHLEAMLRQLSHFEAAPVGLLHLQSWR
jgi:hypothetical protein